MKTQLRFFLISLLFAVSTLSVAKAQPTATARLDSVRGCPGEIVEVPVRIYGISEDGLNSITFHFQMDTSKAMPVLLSWDALRNMGSPQITDWNETLLKRGGIRAENSFLGNGIANIVVVWLDVSFGEPKLEIQDGDILFKLNVQIKEASPTSTINIHLMNAYYDIGWEYKTAKFGGHLLPKSVPDVKIEGSDPFPLYNANGLYANHQICVDQTLLFNVSGAERYEWAVSSGSGRDIVTRELEMVLSALDKDNLVFTPLPTGNYTTISGGVVGGYRITDYTLTAKGYNSDGCVGENSVRISVVFNERALHDFFWSNTPYANGEYRAFFLYEQPDHRFVKYGDTINLAFLFPDIVRMAYIPNEEFNGHLDPTPFYYRWFPEEMVQSPRDSSTWTMPIYEPTWFVGEFITARGSAYGGCSRFINFRVDLLDGPLYGNLENTHNDIFCGEEAVAQQNTTLAALVRGGGGKRTYTWEFRELYNTGDSITRFQNFTPDSSKVDIVFFGTTEVSVRITDSETTEELFLIDTLFVEPQVEIAVHIQMDEHSQRQYEQGYCFGMPITFVATVENAGIDYKVFWETNGYRHNGVEGLKVTFDRIEFQKVYSAVLVSSKKCIAQNNVRSNEIDPKGKSSSVIFFTLNDPEHTSECNDDLVDLDIRIHGQDNGALFQIYRNDELLEEFTQATRWAFFNKYVETLNYWDVFKMRVTNTENNCLPQQFNNVFSNYKYYNVKTNENLKISGIASDLGGDTICDNPYDTYTFRLTGMEQFGKNTTVIWMLNNKEWGRYEYNPAMSAAAGYPLPTNGFVINKDTFELRAFGERYAFHINAEGFPKMSDGTFKAGDSLWVIVITGEMCETNGTKIITKSFEGIRPKFAPLKNAELLVTADKQGSCKGSDITFSAEMKHVNFGTINWFFNNRQVGQGTSYTATHLLPGDSVVAVLESRYKCATNLPLRSPTQVIKVYALPEITVISKDTTICNGQSVELSIQTSATHFAWNTDPTLNRTDIRNPIATPAHNSSGRLYYVTVTDDNGCQASADMTVRTAPEEKLSASISLSNPADTIICRDKMVMLRSDDLLTNVQRVWFRNGFKTQNTGQIYTSSTIRDGDVWYLQVTSPTLNTCLSKTVVSNAIEFRVDDPVQQTQITAESTIVCPGDSIKLSAVGGAHYTWTSDDKTFTETGGYIYAKPAVATTYYVQAFGPKSLCFSRDSIKIAIETYIPVEVALRLDPTRYADNCESANGMYVFEAVPVNPGSSPRYDWFVNGNYVGHNAAGTPTFATNTINPKDRMSVQLTANGIVSCRGNIAKSEEIIILERPAIPVAADHILCDNELATIEIENAQQGVTYFWYSSEDGFVDEIGTGTTMNDKPVAQYLILAIGENGCEAFDAAVVEVSAGVQPPANIVLLTRAADVKTRETIVLRNGSTNWTKAFWTFGSEPEVENHSDIVEYSFDKIDTYPITLRLESEDGCESTTTMWLKVLPGLHGIFVPSAFMPNSPNVEDQVLKVYGLEIASLKFTVYSIDGKELFTTTNPQTGWNGKDRSGREMPTGNYSYVVEAKLTAGAGGDEIVKSGIATLIR